MFYWKQKLYYMTLKVQWLKIACLEINVRKMKTILKYCIISRLGVIHCPPKITRFNCVRCLSCGTISKTVCARQITSLLPYATKLTSWKCTSKENFLRFKERWWEVPCTMWSFNFRNRISTNAHFLKSINFKTKDYEPFGLYIY